MRSILSLAIAAALAVAASPAFACVAYVKGMAGVAIADSRADLGGASSGSATSSGMVSGGGGVDCVVSKKVSAGVWADADLYKGLAQSGAPLVIGTSGAKLDHAVSAGVKVGTPLTPYTEAYGVAGYSWAWSEDLKAGPTSISLPQLKGPLAGGGLDTRLDKRWHFDVQYRASFFDKEGVDAAPGVKLSGIDHTVRAGFRFDLSAVALPK